MAEEMIPENSETNPAAESMELVNPESMSDEADLNGDNTNSKRSREDVPESGEENDGVSKKPKLEKSAEEERLEKLNSGNNEADGESGGVVLGPKTFGSSVEMFNYFYKFLHFWPPNVNINKVNACLLPWTD